MKYVGKYSTLENGHVVTNFYDKDRVMLPEGEYVNIDNITVAKLNSELVDKNIVKVKPSSLKKKLLNIDDFIIEEVSNLEKKRQNYRHKIMSNITDILGKISAFDLFEYLEIFSSFFDKGIVITDQNREEKYLEILNIGDEILLEHLEKFLEIKDRVRPISNTYKNTQAALSRIREADSEEELDRIFEAYKKGSA